MNPSAYPAGRVAASKTYEYFSRQRELRREAGLPSTTSIAAAEVIEAVIDAAFWASLRREEGYVPRMSLAILAPEDAEHALVFDEALRLGPDSLTRVSPAVERPGLHVTVWPLPDELRVWGTIRSIPTTCCVIEVVAPGLLVIKHRQSEQSGKFVNVAVLEGDQLKIVDQHAPAFADCPPVVASLLGLGSRASSPESVNVLVELAVSMRAHSRGGSLLVVPGAEDTWRESIVHPMPYAVRPRFSTLNHLMHEPPERVGPQWEADFHDAVEMIAGLTAVDGATVITDRFDLIAFGAKIARRDGHIRVEQVMVTEPIEGAVPLVVHPTQLGGTRHLSAVQFVHDQRDAIALVASQDGRFTVLSWTPRDSMVHAHRVEALLL